MSQTPSPRRRPPWPLCVALLLIPVIGVGVFTWCGGTAASASKGDPVKVALGAASGTRTVQAGDTLQVTAEGGVLTEVTLTDPRGRRLPGGLGDGGSVWTSSEKAAPETKYSLVARTRNAQGGVGTTKESLTTAKAARLNKLVVDPGRQGSVVGAGRPITVTFDFPVTDREAVLRGLSVTSDDRASGSWDWGNDDSGKDQVAWRPARPSKPGTRITLRAELSGVDSGGGRYFATDYDLNFTIGRTCADSAAARVCGKVHVGDPVVVTASSVRGKDERTIGIGDWNAGVPAGGETSALASSSRPLSEPSVTE
ncbi:Ig-like domain-containing protein [Streptomyces sp. NPDC059008]|uniref:Ig-like domain-containing protein n=1 Tax=Streptomyces sp. NPDC059008 TaxID=3346693 RepID=UPI0036A13178